MTASKLGKVLATIVVLLSFSRGFGLERKGQLGVTGLILSGFPSGNFAHLTNTGLGLGLELEYFVSNHIALGMLVNYLPFQGSEVLTFYTLSEEWTTLSYGLFGKYNFSPHKEIVPYLKAGALITSYKTNIQRLANLDSTGEIDTSFSDRGKITLMGGVGMHWDASQRFGFSGELLFTRFFDVVHDLRGIRRDVGAQYVSFNLSATFFLGKKPEQTIHK